MQTSVPLCQACERQPGSISDANDDPDEPYYVCPECHKRLHAKSLRPREWYNLAKRHGWFPFLIHDDFYLQDGTAFQPEEPVVDADQHPMPDFENVRSSAATLLDWCITRWDIRDDEVHAWKALGFDEALSELTRRFASTRNAGIKGCILKIIARALDERAAEFVRYCWSEYPENLALASLVNASARCLPFKEGFDRAVSALSALSPREKRERMYCLGAFSSPAVLDWIEANYLDPAVNNWGHLAARSHPTWARLLKWIEMGRPFSLIALDTLCDLADPRERRSAPAGLFEPPTYAVLLRTLEDYKQRDNVPRVANSIARILENSAKLVSDFPSNS